MLPWQIFFDCRKKWKNLSSVTRNALGFHCQAAGPRKTPSKSENRASNGVVTTVEPIRDGIGHQLFGVGNVLNFSAHITFTTLLSVKATWKGSTPTWPRGTQSPLLNYREKLFITKVINKFQTVIIPIWTWESKFMCSYPAIFYYKVILWTSTYLRCPCNFQAHSWWNHWLNLAVVERAPFVSFYTLLQFSVECWSAMFWTQIGEPWLEVQWSSLP